MFHIQGEARTEILYPKLVYMKVTKGWITKYSHPVQLIPIWISTDPQEEIHPKMQIFTV